ncbi:cytochrome P460 family protein [Paraferrimonas haliotis]|uniref:Cytochrome P460 domain-containing protein n=1 Tax=Paraferrimonas haliotis TaxID=2013866 RepID=A0AA37WW74_9GAMM|nr:cytochrome P460 family protein [Paraferrimonas haliotis]GLS83057.1 hypothetical protein GCM10007894_10340 [Paraferrimonas haliotis]
MKLLAALLLLSMPCYAMDISDPKQSYAQLVDDKGNISFPTHFQTDLVHLGTTAVFADGKQLQNLNGIYTQKLSIEHFNKTGEWLDGTVFFKDIKFVEKQPMTTGLVYHQQGNDVFFVMIKDNKGRFAGNPHWGEGWGWAMFDAEPGDNISDNRQFCQACHEPRKDWQWLHLEQYPKLINVPKQ